MKRKNQQYVRVSADFANGELSASAVKVLFLLSSVAQAKKNSSVAMSNAAIAKRTNLSNISRITKELLAIGAITQVKEQYKDNRQRCNIFVLADCVVNPESYAFVPANAVELSGNALRLLETYCLYAKRNGRCLLSLSALQRITGMTRSTVTRCNNELTEKGFVTKQRYVTKENDYGFNRVYLTHMLRHKHSSRLTEAFRIFVDNVVLDFESKNEAEGALYGNANALSHRFQKLIQLLFRSTTVARFLRRLRKTFFVNLGGSPKMITRNNILLPRITLRI